MHCRRGLLRLAVLIAIGASGAGRVDAQAIEGPLRVFYTGHSFHMFVPARIEQMAQVAGLDYQHAGKQGIGGSKVIQHWELATDKNQAKAALETGKVDVFTMACHLMIPDPGIDNFAELGLKHNPKLRLIVQCSWVPFDMTSLEQRIDDNAQRDSTDLDALQAASDAWRKKVEAQADAINARHGRKAVALVPAGDAVLELRRLVAAGKFPGVNKQAELFRDPIGHGLAHVQELASYCNFAVIFRRDPQGLKLAATGIDPQQEAILQRIAWQTVSKYPYAGLTTNDQAAE